MRTEISSLSIKMSRYFISIPEGPEALTLFNVALLHSGLMCSLLLPPSLPCLPCVCLRPALSLAACGGRRQPCTLAGSTRARAPSEVIDFNQWLGRLELNDALDFKQWSAALFVVGGGGGVAAGDGTLLLTRCQINKQTALYI